LDEAPLLWAPVVKRIVPDGIEPEGRAEIVHILGIKGRGGNIIQVSPSYHRPLTASQTADCKDYRGTRARYGGNLPENPTRPGRILDSRR